MTKKNAFAVSKFLDTRCDQAYLFATKVGASGCVTASRNFGDGWALLTLFINLIEKVMEQLNVKHHAGFRAMLIRALQNYMGETAPKPKDPPLSDKERAKRIKRNAAIVDAVEEALKWK